MNRPPASDAPIVLVHGAWHGAWAWSPVLPSLAAAGRVAVALDAQGHGLHAAFPAANDAPSPLAHLTLDSAAAQLATELEAIGRPVVLAGHSLLGHLVTAVAGRRPELVERLVYVCAVLPASGADAFGYAASPESAGEEVGALIVADPGAVGALRIDPRSADEGYRAKLRHALFADVPAEVADNAIRLLSSDMPLGIPAGSTELTADGFGAIPRTYVRCADDLAIRPALQDRMVAEADAAYPSNPTRVVELAGSHSPFLSRPRELADALLTA